MLKENIQLKYDDSVVVMPNIDDDAAQKTMMYSMGFTRNFVVLF